MTQQAAQQTTKAQTNTSGQGGTVSKMKKHLPVIYLIGATPFLIIFLIGFMFQIQTNEANILGGGPVDLYHPNWGVLIQLPMLLAGKLDAVTAKAAFWGWFVETLMLGAVIGLVEMRNAVGVAGKIILLIFDVSTVVIIGYNMISDYSYGTIGTGGWGQFGFAFGMSFAVAFFGIIGVWFISLGWHKTA